MPGNAVNMSVDQTHSIRSKKKFTILMSKETIIILKIVILKPRMSYDLD